MRALRHNGVELVLRPGMTALRFFHCYPFGFSPGAVEHLRAYQMVVYDYVGLLHKTKRTHCQQVGAPRSRSYQVNSPGCCAVTTFDASDRYIKKLLQTPVISCVERVSQYLLEKTLPDTPAQPLGADPLLDERAMPLRERCCLRQSRRHLTLYALTYQPC